MGPPPPSPRIEGQQNQHPTYNRKPRPSVATAPPLSSYASLASAPPPSFARKTSTTTTSSTSNNANTGTTSGDHLYRSSPRSSSSTFVPRVGSGTASGTGSSSTAGRTSSGGRTRYDGGGRISSSSSSSVGGRGGRAPSGLYRGGGGSGGGSSGGRGGRYEDRFGGGTRTASSSSLGDSRGPSGGSVAVRGRGEAEGGRFYNNRRGGRDPSASGRFDSTSRGRGRGRDYMYVGRGGRGGGGRSYHRGGGVGRGGYSRDESGRGRYGDGYGGDNSYSSFGDNNSVGEPHPRSNSFSDDLLVDGPPPGEIRGTYHRSNTGGSDGGRSVSPHPSQGAAYSGRRPYGSFSNNSTSNLNEFVAEFRRSGSQDGEPGEDDPNAFFPPNTIKRRREDAYPAAAEETEPPKRIARDPITDTPSEAAPPPCPPVAAADGGDGPPSAESSSRANANELVEEVYRNVESRLTEEGRWTSPSGVSRDSPHSTRRLYSGSGPGGQFDDASEAYRDSFGRGRGRGRGRVTYRGRGGGRGDYNRSSAGEYSGPREYGSRFSSGSDRRPSATVLPEGGRPAENSPRPFPQYSDLASTSAPNWRRHDSDDGPPVSPRASDWRKPIPAPRVISSYATLAANPPPPRPSPSTPAKPLTPVVRPPTPEPEKAKTPPPSPGPPSGYTTALTRLADLEAQMEFAYAKHILLVKRHQVLMTQYEHLEGLPVGLEAFQAELEAMVGAEKAHRAEDAALYG